MFAPDHARTAGELVRVTRPGGTIALASWTPDGLVGDMFATIGLFAPPPAGVRPAVLWGSADHLREIFGNTVEWVYLKERVFHFCYRSPEHFSQWFRQHYGPITRLAGNLSEDDEQRFGAELADVARSFAAGSGPTLDAHGAYLEAIGIRKN